VRGSVADALAGAAFDAERCDDAPQRLDEGTHRVTTDTESRTGLQVDRVVLAPDVVEPAATAPATGPSATVTSSDRLHRTVQVDGCPDGCWLVLGEGYHESWSARTDDGSLGPPQLVDGGFNGWWIPPSSTATTVHIAWTAQGPLDVALAVSLAVVVMAVVLAVADRRRLPPSRRTAPASWLLVGASDGLARSAVAAAAWVVGAALFVTPRYAVWGLLGGLVLVAARRVRVAGVVAIVALCYIAYEVVDTVRTEHPDATPLFPGRFEQLHHLGLFAAVSLAVTVAARARRRPAR
jgi:arabinofuranan 3-O-arabinosyltransferase